MIAHKYCPSNKTGYWGGSGSPDNKVELEPGDDAARVILGGGWRMPTDAEWTELRTNCTWTWTDNYNGSGTSGYVVSSTNGNSIFLPAAGSRYQLSYENTYGGLYWSSSLYTDDPYYAWFVGFSSSWVARDYGDIFYFYGAGRSSGLSIRPVTK